MNANHFFSFGHFSLGFTETLDLWIAEKPVFQADVINRTSYPLPYTAPTLRAEALAQVWQMNTKALVTPHHLIQRIKFHIRRWQAKKTRAVLSTLPYTQPTHT